MDENPVEDIGIVANGNINKKERNQMHLFFFFQVYYQVKNRGFCRDSRPGTKKQRRLIDKIIDCCTKKLCLDRFQVDDALESYWIALFRVIHTTVIFVIR